LELRCAETHLRLTQLLLESTARLPARKGTRTLEAQLSDCQRRFALCCRNADQLLRTVPQPESTARERSGERAVETEAGHPHERVAELQERLEALRRENRRLTEANGMGALRRDAERLARRSGATDEGRPGGPAGTAPWDVEGLAVSGRPFYRLSGDATPGPVAATAPLLVTSAGLEWRRAVGATALLACGLLAVWLLSAFPSFVALTQVFWPEQVVLLGLFGLQTVGATWPVVFLLVLGGSARVLAVVGGLLRSVQRSRPQQPHPA